MNPALNINKIRADFDVADIADSAWKTAEKVSVDSYWSGLRTPEARQFTVDLLWSETTLYVRFEADQAEPLVVSDDPDVTRKAMNLWDRDVCEIFVAAERDEPRKYFEFEVAPTGEWLDVAIDLTSGSRVSDWEYASKLEAAARIDSDKIVMAMKIPWTAFGKVPKSGDVWLGNLFRCVGKDPNRGYLAWRPTLTAEPAFHVPEKFGEFRFVE